VNLFKHTKLFPILALVSLLLLEVVFLPAIASLTIGVSISSSGSIVTQPPPTALFSDGFESGSANAWTGYHLDSFGSTITVQSNIVNTGTYAERATLGTRGSLYWSSYFKTFATAYSTLYVSAYVRFSATPTSGNYLDLCPAIGDVGDTHDIEYVAVYNNGGTMQWALMYRTNSASSNYVYSSTSTPTINTWYWLQIKFVGASGTGEARLYVNGADVAHATGLTNDAILPREILAGASSDVTLSVSVYVDDVSADINYINPSGVLSASILPQSGTIYTNQTVTFTATVSGGVLPYTYRWVQNGGVVNGATTNTWNFVPPSTGTYNIYANVTDSNSTVTKSNTATVTVLAIPSGLTVTLNSPSNGSQPLSTSNLTFTYSPSVYADTIRNASLWMNLTGTWQAVANNASAIQNGAQNTFSYNLTSLGTYIWNVKVFNSTMGVFASSNNSLTITAAATKLTVVLNSPSGSQQISTSNVTFTYTPTCYGDTIKNASLWTNVTGSWARTANNVTAVLSGQQNSFSYNLAILGTYVWNVQVFNSTNGVFASSNMSLTITSGTQPWIKTVGPNVEFQNGTIVYLRGVDIPSGFTASCTGSWSQNGDWIWGYSYTHFDRVGLAQRLQEAKTDGFNTLRLVFNPTWWQSNSATNLNGQTTDTNIRTSMLQTIQGAATYGIFCVITPWSTNGDPISQFGSATNFVSFWSQAATLYGSQPNVLFELYNEPVGTYSTWLSVVPQAVAAIRAVSSNIVVVQYGYCGSFGFVSDFAPVLSSYGNIIYSNHIYRYPPGATMDTSVTTTAQIESNLRNSWSYGSVIGIYPMWIGEIGAWTAYGSGETTWFNNTLRLLNSWGAGYCAWEWNQLGTGWDLQTGSAFPYSLNSDGQVLVSAIAAGTSSQSSTSESLASPTNGASQQMGGGGSAVLYGWEGNQLGTGYGLQYGPT
jgi:hypothetical protein